MSAYKKCFLEMKCGITLKPFGLKLPRDNYPGIRPIRNINNQDAQDKVIKSHTIFIIAVLHLKLIILSQDGFRKQRAGSSILSVYHQERR